MRLTVDIDDEILEQVMKLTGVDKKGPAIAKAVNEFIRRQLAKEFGRKVMEGEFGDYPMTNEELEECDR